MVSLYADVAVLLLTQGSVMCLHDPVHLVLLVDFYVIVLIVFNLLIVQVYSRSASGGAAFLRAVG